MRRSACRELPKCHEITSYESLFLCPAPFLELSFVFNRIGDALKTTVRKRGSPEGGLLCIHQTSQRCAERSVIPKPYALCRCRSSHQRIGEYKERHLRRFASTPSPLSPLILRSGAFAASRRMKPPSLAVRDGAARLLAMREKLSLRLLIEHVKAHAHLRRALLRASRRMLARLGQHGSRRASRSSP